MRLMTCLSARVEGLGQSPSSFPARLIRTTATFDRCRPEPWRAMFPAPIHYRRSTVHRVPKWMLPPENRRLPEMWRLMVQRLAIRSRAHPRGRSRSSTR